MSRKKPAREGFKVVTGATGAQLYVAAIGGDHAASMKLLRDAGLRPLRYQEALLLLMHDEKLKRLFGGKAQGSKWFWLAGEGIHKKGVFTIDGQGELLKRRGEIPPEQRVWIVRTGERPLMLMVESDHTMEALGSRFMLYEFDPSEVAHWAVGLPATTL